MAIASQSVSAAPVMSESAVSYLNHALDLMQKHALHRKEIDWKQLRNTARAYASEAQTTEDTYPAIVYSCAQLKDHASRLQMPPDTPAAIQQRSRAIEVAAKEHRRPLTQQQSSPFLDRSSFVLTMLDRGGKRYAYIVIPFSASFHAEFREASLRHKWAESLLSLVRKASQNGANGWILDIRGNRGGYLAPMLAGLYSLLGDGKVLELHGPDSTNIWSINGSKVINCSGFQRVSVEETTDETPQANEHDAPVVILLDRDTESAAESLAIAFQGRPRTLFIGERTAGLTTSGVYWDLSDGAVLSIMSQEVRDRRGQAYPEGIEPSIRVADSSTPTAISEDPAIRKGITWLSTDRQP